MRSAHALLHSKEQVQILKQTKVAVKLVWSFAICAAFVIKSILQNARTAQLPVVSQVSCGGWRGVPDDLGDSFI